MDSVRAGETARGGGRGVGRGGGCARGTVGVSVRACGGNEMGSRVPHGTGPTTTRRGVPQRWRSTSLFEFTCPI